MVSTQSLGWQEVKLNMAKTFTHYQKEPGFEVVKLELAEHEGFVKSHVKYPSSDQVYTYIRKYKPITGTPLYETVVDGCGIKFGLHTLKVVSVTRYYDTTGRKRTVNTGKSSKKYDSDKNNKNKTKTVIGDIINHDVEIKNPEHVKPDRFVIDKPNKIDYDNTIVHHEKYDTIKKCLITGIPVYLAGPAGSGKNYTIEQISSDLDWEFFYSNSVQQEYKLTGFIDAGGNYHETEFYKACVSKKECVFFLDEMDASIPEVLVLLNAAIANGYFEFPCGRVELDNVHFVAAGNTVGSGSDELYTGRMVLDQATLDRFAIIEFNYSPAIENVLSHGNADLLKFVHQLRHESEIKGIRATFSYRCITMVTKLEGVGMDTDTIIVIAVMKGLDMDTIRTFCPEGNTKYHESLRRLQNAS